MGFFKNIAVSRLDRLRTITGAVVNVRLKLYKRQVIRAVRRKRSKVLYKLGGYCSKSMKRSMRYREGPSPPGRPPHAHRHEHAGFSAALRRLIRFDVNKVDGSVIIGPMRFGQVSQPSGMPVPQLLDQGGPVLSYLPESGVSTIASIAPRPYTSPIYTDGGKRFNELLEEVSL